ncbi:MAG TPA: N4-gp56 family major capsid protein [Methanosarcina sp.]|nr:N4-gp56 family major capsid protein [Methanosarcina sp.]
MASNIYGNGTTTATAGANTIVHYYDRAGINMANRVNVYQQFADRKSMPQQYGKTFKISRFEHMYDRDLSDSSFATKGFLTSRDIAELNTALTNATLAEGAGAVNQRTLKKVTYETSFARYGEMIDYTDEVDIWSEDYIQVKYREELGELANARYEDLIQRDMLSTTTVMYPGAAAAMSDIGTGVAVDGSSDANWTVSYDIIRKAVRKLVRNRAKKNTQIVTGSNKIGTTPIAKAYYAIIGADVKSDLETLTRGASYEKEFVFIPAHKYAGASTLAEGEVGAMHEVRFIEAESAVVYRQVGATVPASYVGNLQYTGTIGSGAKFDVFPILFPTEGAFATVGLKGLEKIKFNSKSPAQLENGNPYGTTGFFSYNFFYAGIILRPETLLKVLVAAKN